MSHGYKRPKSKFEQFRMTVPEDLREIFGKTAWTKSLRTTDALIAREKRADLVKEYSALVNHTRADIDRRKTSDQIKLLDRAFAELAKTRGSVDAAIGAQLHLLASFVFDSWQEAEEARQIQWWGDLPVVEPATPSESVPSIDDEPARRLFRLRVEFIEGRGIADGLAYQELATILLERRVFRPIWFVVSYMKSIEPRLDLDDDKTYEAIAEAYLRRLTGHSFTNWADNVRAALSPVSAPPAATLTSPASANVPAHSWTKSPVRPQGLMAMRLSEAYDYWKEQRRPGHSSITEANRAVARFIALFGDVVIGDITRPQAIEFRNLIADIPPQTELKKLEASGRTLRSVIDEAREARRKWQEGDRKGPEPARLAPGSVKKDVGAISAILGKATADVGNVANVADKIEVSGYSKTRKGQVRPHLPFTPKMMQTLFDSPLFTGCRGKGDVARTKPGELIFQDEMYWCFLFCVVSGPRLTEVAQIALSDIDDCDLRRTYGAGYSGSCTFVHITGTGEGQSTKTDESERYVVIHERLIELGFNKYVEQRRAQGKTHLFDVTLTREGNPTKALSQRLNRYIDRVVTKDPRYVFYSMRHEFTDRADLSDMPSRVANSLKGQANLTEAQKYGLVSILHQYKHLKNLELGFIDWPRLMAAAQASPAG